MPRGPTSQSDGRPQFSWRRPKHRTRFVLRADFSSAKAIARGVGLSKQTQRICLWCLYEQGAM
eukprot:198203-Lingulodinium_polyedra.AAC.1